MSDTYEPTPEHARILQREPGRPDTGPFTQGNIPGAADGHAICSGPIVVAIVHGGGYPIGKGWAPHTHATAAYMVRALNAHGPLVDALKRVKLALAGSVGQDFAALIPDTIKNIDDALDLAKQEEA